MTRDEAVTVLLEHAGVGRCPRLREALEVLCLDKDDPATTFVDLNTLGDPDDDNEPITDPATPTSKSQDRMPAVRPEDER